MSNQLIIIVCYIIIIIILLLLLFTHGSRRVIGCVLLSRLCWWQLQISVN